MDGRTPLVSILSSFSCIPPSSDHPFYRSQSRMRGDYLFYDEKVETTQEERDAKAARRYAHTSP